MSKFVFHQTVAFGGDVIQNGDTLHQIGDFFWSTYHKRYFQDVSGAWPRIIEEGWATEVPYASESKYDLRQRVLQKIRDVAYEGWLKLDECTKRDTKPFSNLDLDIFEAILWYEASRWNPYLEPSNFKIRLASECRGSFRNYLTFEKNRFNFQTKHFPQMDCVLYRIGAYNPKARFEILKSMPDLKNYALPGSDFDTYIKQKSTR